MSADPIDARQLRAHSLCGFLRLAEKLLEKPGLSSVHLGCSQYYCDEAGDAVHGSIAVSRSALPTREEASESEREASYDQRWHHVQWDDNGTAVYAFAALCNEEGWTETGMPDDEYGGTVSPLASVHRRRDGSLQAAWLGALHRPWLDFHGALADRDDFREEELEFAADPEPAPLVGREVELHAQVLAAPSNLAICDVLADAWIARDDPRGQLSIAHRAQDRRRAADLVLAHGRSWLGPLARVIPLGGALFGAGPFAEKAIVYGDDAALAAVADAPAWATIRAIQFAPQSEVLITPAMRGLRAVGPIDCRHLPMLAGHAIDELDVRCDDDVAELAQLPHLRTLIVRARGAIAVPPIAGLERVELWLPGGADAGAVREAFRATVVPAGCTLAVGILHGTHRTGLLYAGDRILVHRPDARFDQGAAWSKALALPLPDVWEPDGDDWLAFGLGVA